MYTVHVLFSCHVEVNVIYACVDTFSQCYIYIYIRPCNTFDLLNFTAFILKSDNTSKVTFYIINTQLCRFMDKDVFIPLI